MTEGQQLFHTICTFPTGKFPEAEIRAVMEQMDELTPVLLEKLDEIIQNPDIVDGEENEDFSTGICIGLALLGHFRVKEAHERMTRMAQMVELKEFWGDTMSETMPGVLAATFAGDLQPLINLIEDEGADEFARAAGISTLYTLVGEELLPVESVAPLLFGWWDTLKCPEDALHPFDVLADVCCSLHLTENREKVIAAYEDGRCDGMFSSLSDNLKIMDGSWPYPGEAYERHSPLTEMPKAISWWAIWSSEQGLGLMGGTGSHFDSDVALPILPGLKIGRNDPCPCGSGKKYKKCCLN